MEKPSPFEGKRLVLFDLDGTLRKLRPSSLEKLVSIGADLGLTFAAEARRRAIRWSHEYWATNDRVHHDLDRFGRDAFLENYLALYLKALGVDGAGAKKGLIPRIIARFREEFAPEPYLEPGAKELLWKLREAGLKLGLVSNRDNPLTGLAIELGVIEHFHFTLAAGQVNSWKPKPEIFLHALKLGGNVPPEKAVYVGDNYYADVVGARGAGISAVLLDEEGAFPDVQDKCHVISKLADLKQAAPKKRNGAQIGG